jgi:uncharacterized protein YlzI (FlbEa/FlbD family)
MIPNWIEVTCVMRGKRMINLDLVTDFFSVSRTGEAEITMINVSDGDRITVRESYDEIAIRIEERRRSVFNYLDKLMKAIRGVGEPG